MKGEAQLNVDVLLQMMKETNDKRSEGVKVRKI